MTATTKSDVLWERLQRAIERLLSQGKQEHADRALWLWINLNCSHNWQEVACQVGNN